MKTNIRIWLILISLMFATNCSTAFSSDSSDAVSNDAGSTSVATPSPSSSDDPTGSTTIMSPSASEGEAESVENENESVEGDNQVIVTPSDGAGTSQDNSLPSTSSNGSVTTGGVVADGANGSQVAADGEGDGETSQGDLSITVAPVISEWDLSTGAVASGVSLNDCVIASNGVTLPQTSSGVYANECHIDIDLSSSDVSTKQFVLNDERINAFNKTDLTSLTGNDIGLYNPSSTSLTVAKSSGIWLSSARTTTVKPSVITDGSGTQWVQITKYGSLEQIIAITPGESYDLAFDLDPSFLTADSSSDQVFYTTLVYYDKDFKALTFLEPINKTTGAKSIFRTYSNKFTPLSEKIRIRAIDGDEHVKYKVGEGTSTTDESFSYNKDSSGTALTNESGTVYTASDIAYIGISFAVNWHGDGYALIKNLSFDPVKQFETELLDASGTLTQSSTDDDGFVVESTSNNTMARIYIRTNNTAKSPKLKGVSLGNTPLTVAVDAKINTFTNPRIGFTGGIPPASEWDDATSVRSLCSFNDETPTNCWTFLSSYGVGRFRTAISTLYLDVSLSGSTYSFQFHEGTYSLHMEPVTLLKHFVEAGEAGMNTLLIIDNGSEGAYWWGRSINGYTDSTTGYLNSEYDPTRFDDTNDVTETIALFGLTGAYQAELFNLIGSYTFADGTSYNLPRIDAFQIGVETNIAESTWVNNLSVSQHATMLHDIAAAVQATDPSAKIETSLNPNNAWLYQTFDTSYIETTLSQTDATPYSHFNFNIFSDGTNIIPEDWFEGWSELSQKSYFSAWKDKTLSVGAFDYSYESYDPACNTKWTRGFGDKAAAKLEARTLLTALAMNVEDVYDYTVFSSEGWSGLNLKRDSCWKSDSGYNDGLFTRVAGTGSLDGIDEPSEYRVNDSGIAALTIAKNISTSSPYAITIDGEDFYSGFYETSAGKKFVALWHAPKVAFATDDMTYVSGFKEDGLTENRKIDLTLTGAGTATSATRIALNGDASQTLAVSSVAGGVTISGIELDGDMPVLIELQ